MKCNCCSTKMEEAYLLDSDRYGCKEIAGFKINIGFVSIGNLVCCPKCGNIQVSVTEEN